ncbi:hypothetical protein OEZ85_012018 [Tetradesmus obliquus]|uniref:Uncharacterized protein n=1 Tax=Tetradesmus obliquus TaxID=3088 RepID=A0ABY8TS31_TETOB|nr:hypothetical protein OEZ85_012018 [Tetradesmus obliquus]
MITGGNTGIGYETAKVLLAKGYSVTLACRDASRASNAVQRLQQQQPGAPVDYLLLDLADLASVRDAANKWMDSGKQIDVLLNNAGVMACPRMETAQGYEYQLGVNHLGHFLWTNTLLPLLKQNPNPVRIVNVASTAHMFGKMDFDDLQSRNNYDRWRAYGQSKLANILFTYELARKLQPSSSITANCLHPGVVRTELSRYLMTDPDALTSKLLTALFTPFTLSPEQGALTNIYCCSSPDVEGISGKYYDSCKPVASTPASYDTATAAKLWSVSKELTQAYAKAPAAV